MKSIVIEKITILTYKGRIFMKDETTHEFVEHLHEKQQKAEKNQAKQGHNRPSKKLPNKQH